MEDVVVSFTGRARPDVALGIPAEIHAPVIRPERCVKIRTSVGLELDPITKFIPKSLLLVVSFR